MKSAKKKKKETKKKRLKRRLEKNVTVKKKKKCYSETIRDFFWGVRWHRQQMLVRFIARQVLYAPTFPVWPP